MSDQPTPDDQVTYLRKLRTSVRRLEENPDWLALKAHLFRIAPPGQDAFSAADNYNTHAAARRDGASQLTKVIEDLAMPTPEPKKPKANKSKGEFVGEEKQP